MWEAMYDFIFGVEDKFIRIDDWRDMTEEKVNAYVMKGADANYTEEDGWTVLMDAAAGGASLSVLRRLVELGADPNTVNNYGSKAQDYTSNKVCKNVLRKLCDEKPKTIARHNTKPINSSEHIKE